MSIQTPKISAARVVDSAGGARAAKRVDVRGEAERKAAAPTLETIKNVAVQLESYMKSVGRSIDFKVDQASGRTVISVRDSNTGELIRQIPSEEVLRLAHSMDANSLFVSLTA